ncbi:MAG TPA: Fic family protein [Euzebyales bacterium]|nr:Fic family protein [Euzebyales bacterium]
MAETRVWSPYGAVLESERAALVAALDAHVDDELIDAAQRRSARLSVRLDASPLDDATADAVDRELLDQGGRSGPWAGGQRRAEPPEPIGNGDAFGWARALKLEGMPTPDIAALEYRGVREAQMEEDRLARGFFADPVATLVEAHRLIAGGLVSEGRLGALRSTSRAVTDGAQGMVIFHAPDPARLPRLLEDLDGWLRDARDRHAPLAIAGVVHLRLLAWHPFEAGNGRVARLASRVVLRATAGDPWGVAVPEQSYARDPLRYVAEVAATIRRRSDLAPWIEQTGEAVVASLEVLARASGVEPPAVPARGVHECQRLPAGASITVPEYAAVTECDREAAMMQLNQLCWSGLLDRDPGTHGLRYVRAKGDGVR